MTLPKKRFRPITVNGIVYRYNITGEDEGIRFIVGLPNINGQVIIGYISYHSNWVSNYNEEGIAKSWNLYQRIIVTPKTIRAVILYGLANNWKPTENLKQLNLGTVDENISLQLKEITKFPSLIDNEVAVVFQTKNERLNTNFELYNGAGNIYHQFDNIDLAIEFAQLKIKENANLNCWILYDFNKALMFIAEGKLTEFKNN